eukprot:11182808-Lingulodinium_polyedra.AAC.1
MTPNGISLCSVPGARARKTAAAPGGNGWRSRAAIRKAATGPSPQTDGAWGWAAIRGRAGRRRRA